MSKNQSFASDTTDDGTQSLKETVEEVEIRMIKEALRESGGNRQKASEILGISRQGLLSKIKRYGLSYETEPEIRRPIGLVQECQNCGKENSSNGEFCCECGHELSERNKPDKTVKLGGNVKPNKTPKPDEPQSYITEHLNQEVLGGRVGLEGEHKQATARFLQKRKPGLAAAISILLIAMILGGWFALNRNTLFSDKQHRLALLYVRSQAEDARMAQLIEDEINQNLSSMSGIEWIAREGVLDLFSAAGVTDLSAIEELETNACEAARRGGLDYSLVGRLKPLGKNSWRLDSEIICTTTRSVVGKFSIEGPSAQSIVFDLQSQVQDWVKENL